MTVGGAESFVVKVLLGKRDIPEMELCARTLMSKMAKDGCTRSLLISLALKDHSMQTITGVIKKIQELRVW